MGWRKSLFQNGLALTASARSGSLHADPDPRVGLGDLPGPAAMTKSELIAHLAAENAHLRQPDIELIVATIFDEITAALARGDRVELRGFGAFSAKKRDARLGRNPRTGAPVPVSQKTIPFFKTGKQLRDRLNGKESDGEDSTES